MHLYIATRGIKSEVDKFIGDLQAQYLQYGKDHVVQLAVRPIQFWEFVFPENAFPEVLKTICPTWNGKTRKELKLPFKAIRTALGAKPVPTIDLSQVPTRHTSNVYGLVATYPIGIKKDKIWPEGHPLEGREQL